MPRHRRSTRTDEVSRLAKLGESMTCMTMAGTPPKMVMRSRSISSSARSGSKWCIITNLPPAAVFDTSTAWHPVAWKRGTERRLAFWVPLPAATEPAAAHGAHGGHEEQVHQIGHAVAVGPHCALGPSRGPRGVEDGGVVVGLDGYFRKRRLVGQVVGQLGKGDHRQRPRPGSIHGRSLCGPPATGGAGSSQQTIMDCRPGTSPRWGRMRPLRSSSTNTTDVPESLSP